MTHATSQTPGTPWGPLGEPPSGGRPSPSGGAQRAPAIPRQRNAPPVGAGGFAGSLQPHQADGVRWLLPRPKAVLAHAVGLGKTITAFALIDQLDQLGCLPATGQPLCRVLWLTEPSLIEQTRAEVARFLPGFTVLTANDPELKTGPAAQKRRMDRYPNGVDLLILSHGLADTRSQWLEEHQPAMLVVDEAVNGDTVAFRAIRTIAQRTPGVLSMTATPLENDPMELWRLLAATDTPGLCPQEQFENEFVVWRFTPRNQWGGQQKVAYEWQPLAPPIVRAYLAGCLLRRTPEQIGQQLPVKVGRHHV